MTLPVSVRSLLEGIQQQQAALTNHHHLNLTAIQRHLGLGELFDTSIVFQNAPWDETALHATLDQLLGPGTVIADTWTWKVSH